MSDPASRPTSSAISAYARNARRAVRLQVIVAGLAFLATVVFAILITGQTAKLNEVNADLKAASSRLGTTDNATQAVLQAASALASGEPARYNAAIESLRTVRRDLALVSAELDSSEADAANADLRNVRFSVTRTLASALFTRPGRSPDELAEAIALESENLAQPALADTQVYASTIALATYRCEAGEEDSVRALLTDTFLAANPAAIQNGVLPDKCRDLIHIDAVTYQGDGPPFDPASADPEFRIRTVYLHIGAESDRAAAQALGKALCTAGYSVPGIEKVAAPSSGQLRYYYPEQVSEAEHIATLFKVDAPPALWWAPPAVRQLGGIDNLDRHTAEIWLPQSTPTPGSSSPLPAAEARFRCSPSAQTGGGDTAALAAQLTSADKALRLSAGQAIADRMRSQEKGETIAALVAQLQPPRLEQLSASGRLNVLYMLNLEPSWQTRPEAQDLSSALATVRARASQGVAIGGQTNDCLTKLETKLAGGTAPDACGGL